LSMVDLARDFEELESFAEKFGGESYFENPRFASVINEIEFAFKDKDAEDVDDNLKELKFLIERYLPIRNKAAPIMAEYSGGKLVISGALKKIVQFPEDLFIDIYDQQGNIVDEIALKDTAGGKFSKVVNKSFDSGVYVTQLQYHDVIVTDFFNVK